MQLLETKQSGYNLTPYTEDERRIIQERLYERPSHYSGPDFYGTIALFGQTRDSDILEKSNHAVALDRLGGESDPVMVHRAGHWACGWVEVIRVDITDVAKTKIACELIREYESYPVLDESDYSDRQVEYYSEWAEQSKDSVAKVLVRLFGLPEELEKLIEKIEEEGE